MGVSQTIPTQPQTILQLHKKYLNDVQQYLSQLNQKKSHLQPILQQKQQDFEQSFTLKKQMFEIRSTVKEIFFLRHKLSIINRAIELLQEQYFNQRTGIYDLTHEAITKHIAQSKGKIMLSTSFKTVQSQRKKIEQTLKIAKELFKQIQIMKTSDDYNHDQQQVQQHIASYLKQWKSTKSTTITVAKSCD